MNYIKFKKFFYYNKFNNIKLIIWFLKKINFKIKIIKIIDNKEYILL